jgi:hypothetical protein
MRIPRFWAVAEGSTGTRRKRLFRRAWGWSMSSAAEAVAVAHEQLRLALDNPRPGVRAGRYYPRKPLREPILDELLIEGEQALAVTRNRYGAEILNTDRLLIADVDLPELQGRTSGGLLRRLFRRQPPAADPMVEPVAVVERLGTLADWARANPDLGVIVYRTASGLRVFVTGVEEPASSTRGEQILVELGADPIYCELCRTHRTFRARLTPKPWRLPSTNSPLGRWPYANGKTEQRFNRWLAHYDEASRGYAVCRRLATYGSYPSTLEEHIIRLHDVRTRVADALPLA